jgi:D-cysteine desulfhydrase family pyridoxal phosphate-dependent enzyme
MNTKVSLGFFPTPLEKLSNLSKKYPNYNIYIKRDDQTGLATGGNKTRKLEYLMQDALLKNCNTIITAGAQQSNHCRQTAAACAKLNLKCHLLLGGFEPKTFTGNLLLSKQLGATIHFTGDNRKGEDINVLEQKLIEQNLSPYIIPYGGSNLIGAMGFVNAVKELKQQLSKEKLNIDAIFFASSSGGTQAGLQLGKQLYKLNTKLYPIAIDKIELGEKQLNEIIFFIVKEGQQTLSLKDEITIEECNLIENYNKAGYGKVTRNERFAIETLAKTDGILLDPVYTGRAFYGMLDMLDSEKLPANSNILFWHTGGIPASFHYSNELQ